MDWSRTKTIFIVTFMLLNIFLGYQLSEKHSQLDELTLPELESRIEEQEIEIMIDDVEEEFMGAPITAYQRSFQEVLIEQSLEAQTPQFVNETTIYSVLDSPYRLPNVNLQASIDAFLQQYVFRGEEYELAVHDEELGIIGIYQTFDGKKIDEYERDNFHITLELNEEGDIIAYTQRYMNITEQGEEQELLTPIRAIEVLLNDTGEGIGAGSEVTSAELGYYNLMEVEANFQIFAPVWRVVIDEETHYVNAMTGEVQRIS